MYVHLIGQCQEEDPGRREVRELHLRPGAGQHHGGMREYVAGGQRITCSFTHSLFAFDLGGGHPLHLPSGVSTHAKGQTLHWVGRIIFILILWF